MSSVSSLSFRNLQHPWAQTPFRLNSFFENIKYLLLFFPIQIQRLITSQMATFYELCMRGNFQEIHSWMVNNQDTKGDDKDGGDGNDDKRDNGGIDWELALSNACQGGHMDIVKLVISQTCCARQTLNYWNSGFKSACYGGHMNIVKFILTKGANDWNGGLIMASGGGHMEIVQFMISNGACSWYNAFSFACSHGRAAVAKLIDPNVLTWNGSALFSQACRSGSVELVELFLNKKHFEMSSRFLDVLCDTCVSGNLELVELLISSRTNPFWIVQGDQTAWLTNQIEQSEWNRCLLFACARGHMAIATFIISKGANNWTSAFQSACKGGNIDLVNLMISKGSPVLPDWQSGFFDACDYGHVSIVELMISKGAKEWALGFNRACERGHVNVVQFLIQQIQQSPKGQKVNFDWNYGFARFSDYYDSSLVKTMIEHGATNIAQRYSWPRNKLYIQKLLYLRTNLEKFQNINGYQELKTRIDNFKQAVLMSNVLIQDLLHIIVGYSFL